MRASRVEKVNVPKRTARRHQVRSGSDIDLIETRHGADDDDFLSYLDRVTGIVDAGMSTDDLMKLMRG